MNMLLQQEEEHSRGGESLYPDTEQPTQLGKKAMFLLRKTDFFFSKGCGLLLLFYLSMRQRYLSCS